MVNLTHLVFNERHQDRKARKKSTVKYIILVHLKYPHSFKHHFKANAELLHTNTREFRGRVKLQSLGGTNAPDIPCACSGEPDKMIEILCQRRLQLQWSNCIQLGCTVYGCFAVPSDWNQRKEHWFEISLKHFWLDWTTHLDRGATVIATIMKSCEYMWHSLC